MARYTADHDAEENQLCLICEKPMTLLTERCVTDCCHEFCLGCVCLHLADRKNKCPACFATVKRVFQMFTDAESSAAREPSAKPAQVKFCNATYVLDVSIWSVEDPSKRLASLFDLEHARLIHQGKLLKKGDVWPGSVVQLFGTRRNSQGSSNALASSVSSCLRPLKHQLEPSQLNWLAQFVCCPCSLVFRFFHSLFFGKEYNSLPRRGYQPIDPMDQARAAAAQANAFHEPGRVGSPHHTDSI